jgi:hypothetical protein
MRGEHEVHMYQPVLYIVLRSVDKEYLGNGRELLVVAGALARFLACLQGASEPYPNIIYPFKYLRDCRADHREVEAIENRGCTEDEHLQLRLHHAEMIRHQET